MSARASWPLVLVITGSLACALIVCAAAGAPEAPSVSCLPVDDGAPVTAEALLAVNDREITLEGLATPLRLESVRCIEFSGRPTSEGDFALKARTVEGTPLFVKAIGAGEGDRTTFRGDGWEAAGLRLSDLSALATAEFLRRAPAEELGRFEDARRKPPEGTDRILATLKGGPQLLEVRVTALTPERVAFVWEDLPCSVKWPAVNWIAFASPPPARPAPTRRFRIAMTDGSELEVQQIQWGDGNATGGRGDATLKAEAARVARIEVFSDRYRYLSDSPPDAVKLTPFLDISWEPRPGRCVTGGPLTLAGRPFRHGIGSDARAEMTWRLDGRWSRFLALAGVDDSAGSRGCVIFRVLVDGREAFASPAVRGLTAPVPIAVDCKGAQALTLVSDFGSDLRSDGDLADWADARVTRNED